MFHVPSVHTGRLTSQPELADFHKASCSYFGTRADLYALTRTQILAENSHLFWAAAQNILLSRSFCLQSPVATTSKRNEKPNVVPLLNRVENFKRKKKSFVWKQYLHLDVVATLLQYKGVLKSSPCCPELARRCCPHLTCDSKAL